jgi:glycolate oxidase FAD binding subunit
MTVPVVSSLVDHDPVLADFAESVGTAGAVAVRGAGTRWDLGGPSEPGTRVVEAPTGIITYAPEEMTVRVRAGTPVVELHAALADRGQRTPLVERGGTVGGAIAVGENGIQQLGRGTLRSSVLQVRYVSADGRVINGGGPTVKNVTGFDLPRLMVGSLGTLGLLAEVILRTNPIPAASVWLAANEADPFTARDALQRPSAVLWDGARTWVLLEGHAADLAAQRSVLATLGAYDEVDGPPGLPTHRWSLSPADLRSIAAHDTGSFVAVVGVGLVFAERPQTVRTLSPSVAELHRRMKANFDPTGRLNPGRDPGRR